jgi:hypothetical protein
MMDMIVGKVSIYYLKIVLPMKMEPLMAVETGIRVIGKIFQEMEMVLN